MWQACWSLADHAEVHGGCADSRKYLPMGDSLTQQGLQGHLWKQSSGYNLRPPLLLPRCQWCQSPVHVWQSYSHKWDFCTQNKLSQRSSLLIKKSQTNKKKPNKSRERIAWNIWNAGSQSSLEIRISSLGKIQQKQKNSSNLCKNMFPFASKSYSFTAPFG